MECGTRMSFWFLDSEMGLLSHGPLDVHPNLLLSEVGLDAKEEALSKQNLHTSNLSRYIASL